MAKDKVFGKIIELGTFGQLDAKLRIDATTVLTMNIFRPNVGELHKSILDEKLGDLGDKRNTFSHTFDLDSTMLLEDELAQKQPLIEPRVTADSEYVCIVELGVFLIHVASTSNYIMSATHFMDIINYPNNP